MAILPGNVLPVGPMSRKSPDDRPSIWAEGRQHPPLQARTFALASVLFAREGLGRLLRRCVNWSQGFADRVATGRWRIPEARLGRTGRFLPSYQQVSRAISAGAALLDSAAHHVSPKPEAASEPMIAASFRDGQAASVSPADAHVPSADADLVAIRALMTAPAEAPVATPAMTQPDATAKVSGAGLPHRVAAAVLGYGLLVLAVPYGAVLALLAHLNGEDLRNLVEGG